MLQTKGDRCTVVEDWCVAHNRKSGHVDEVSEHEQRLRAADQALLVEGRCLQCDSPVARAVRVEGPYALIGRWQHVYIDKDTQHGVTNVLPPVGVA